MGPSPIHRVLSSIRASSVESLLIGGQACILYGAAEFSRDTDLAILANADNLLRLEAALAELEARVIAVPPFELEYLDRGHAVHFECGRSDVAGMRVDVMSRLRGVDPFSALVARRQTRVLPDGLAIDVIGLPDLVLSKKTQRDKDWPMIRRLVEVNYLTTTSDPSPDQTAFWLRELRTPTLLVEAVRRFPDVADAVVAERPLLEAAGAGDEARIEAALASEAGLERDRDRAYWAPLRAELEDLRGQARRRRRHGGQER